MHKELDFRFARLVCFAFGAEADVSAIDTREFNSATSSSQYSANGFDVSCCGHRPLMRSNA
ncbi:hypothetical protein [Bradyrhizobium sp. URHD0069]|uniref:hypothetical protein n=1 Tax=Bradyrhizobium sp. URHD0069 TaxID=1380355 RepID=UPI0004950312|nr:hypothetical protein [Bradyrhizobium sp. URHD0069]